MYGVEASKSLEGNTLGLLFHPLFPAQLRVRKLGKCELEKTICAYRIIEWISTMDTRSTRYFKALWASYYERHSFGVRITNCCQRVYRLALTLSQNRAGMNRTVAPECLA